VTEKEREVEEEEEEVLFKRQKKWASIAKAAKDLRGTQSPGRSKCCSQAGAV
jgi:hypothetical protein